MYEFEEQTSLSAYVNNVIIQLTGADLGFLKGGGAPLYGERGSTSLHGGLGAHIFIEKKPRL